MVIQQHPGAASDMHQLRPRSLVQQVWRSRWIYLLLLPCVVPLCIFNYYPPISALYHAFYQWDGVTSTFIGLDNFRHMTSDQDLSVSVTNLLKLLVFGIAVGTIMPIVVAELIFNVKNERVSYLWRLVFVIQVVIPGIVVILLWQFIFDPTSGLLNNLLAFLRLGQFQGTWLGDYRSALYSIMFIGFPFIYGANVLIALAGLQGISEPVLDAARLDGCVGLRRIWSIDLPHILGQIRFFVIIGIIGGVQQFTAQFVLTKGGPGNATQVPGYLLYQDAFQYQEYGYACAIGLVMFLVIMVLTVLGFRFMTSQVEYEGRLCSQDPSSLRRGPDRYYAWACSGSNRSDRRS